jgi:uncharacterized membrane protein
MSQIVVELIVAAFGEEYGAENAIRTLHEADKAPAHGIHDLAVIRRDADNILHIREMLDGDADKTAAAGALIGGVIGLLFPPGVLAPGLISSTVEGLAARLKENGFSDEGIKELGATLKPGTSAIIAIVDDQSADDLEHRLAVHGARVVRQFITTEIVAQLDPDSNLGAADPTQDQARIAQTASPAAPVESEKGLLPESEGNESTGNVGPEAIPPPEQVIDPAVAEGKPDDVV